MNQQTKVSIISGLVMISIIFLFIYYGSPASKRTDKRSDKSKFRFDQNLVPVKPNSANRSAEAIPCCFKTDKAENRSFNIFGPQSKIVLQEKTNDRLRVSDLDLVVN